MESEVEVPGLPLLLRAWEDGQDPPSVIETTSINGQQTSFFFSLGTAFGIWMSVWSEGEGMIALGSRTQSILLAAVLAAVCLP